MPFAGQKAQPLLAEKETKGSNHQQPRYLRLGPERYWGTHPRCYTVYTNVNTILDTRTGWGCKEPILLGFWAAACSQQPAVVLARSWAWKVLVSGEKNWWNDHRPCLQGTTHAVHAPSLLTCRLIPSPFPACLGHRHHLVSEHLETRC